MTKCDIAILLFGIIWVILTGIELTILSVKIRQEEKELRRIRKLRYEFEKKVEEFNKHE